MRRRLTLPGFALAACIALAAPGRAADVTVTLPAASGAPGTLVPIPIRTTPALAGLDVLSVDFRLTFDPAVAHSAQAGTDGTIQNWGPPFAHGTSAYFAEAAAGGDALTLPGTLLNTVLLRLKPTAVVGTVMPLTFQHFTLNGGTPTVVVVAGSVTVTAPAAGVSPPAETGLALAVLSAPTRAEARFAFTVPAGRGDARLAIHAIDGRCVATIAGAAGPGSHTLAWDLRDAHGARVRSGLYFVRLTLGGESLARKLVVAG